MSVSYSSLAFRAIRKCAPRPRPASIGSPFSRRHEVKIAHPSHVRALATTGTVHEQDKPKATSSGEPDCSGTEASPQQRKEDKASETGQESKPAAKKKTMAELDAELRAKMEGHAGDGGDAGLELEDGQPVSMKRSVKNNMFRYI